MAEKKKPTKERYEKTVPETWVEPEGAEPDADASYQAAIAGQGPNRGATLILPRERDWAAIMAAADASDTEPEATSKAAKEKTPKPPKPEEPFDFYRERVAKGPVALRAYDRVGDAAISPTYEKERYSRNTQDMHIAAKVYRKKVRGIE